jgi:hypothetical protein
MEPEKPETPPQPPPFQKQEPPAQQPNPQVPPTSAEPQPMKEEGSQIVRDFPIEKIEKDLSHWLVPLLPNKNLNLKLFIPQVGKSKTGNRKEITSYGVTVPVEQVPALTSDIVRQQLQSASTNSGDISGVTNIYNLDKFDVSGDKYVIIVRKTTTY